MKRTTDMKSDGVYRFDTHCPILYHMMCPVQREPAKIICWVTRNDSLYQGANQSALLLTSRGCQCNVNWK